VHLTPRFSWRPLKAVYKYRNARWIPLELLLIAKEDGRLNKAVDVNPKSVTDPKVKETFLWIRLTHEYIFEKNNSSKTEIFRVISQQVTIISHRRFGTTYLSQLQGSRIKKQANKLNLYFFR
jgi:hypothetical protein